MIWRRKTSSWSEAVHRVEALALTLDRSTVEILLQVQDLGENNQEEEEERIAEGRMLQSNPLHVVDLICSQTVF